MSTAFVSFMGFELLEGVLLPFMVATLPRDDCDVSGSSSLTSPRRISGALHPTVPAAIAPKAVGMKLVWSTSSRLHKPKSDINILWF